MQNTLKGPGPTATIERLGLPTDALAGKTAVVTGGARGIGEAIAEAVSNRMGRRA